MRERERTKTKGKSTYRALEGFQKKSIQLKMLYVLLVSAILSSLKPPQMFRCKAQTTWRSFYFSECLIWGRIKTRSSFRSRLTERKRNNCKHWAGNRTAAEGKLESEGMAGRSLHWDTQEWEHWFSQRTVSRFYLHFKSWECQLRGDS